MSIFYVDSTFNQVKTNPFNNNSEYTNEWIMFKLLDKADFKLYTGGGRDGIFQLVITKQNSDWIFRVNDFIQYETHHNKNIILSIDEADYKFAKIEYGSHNFMDKFLRPYEQKILMHSTTKENYQKIIAEGCLKSWNLLKSEEFILEDNPIGYLLGDPADYSDYIMFTHGGASAERVVSSKQKGIIEMNIDTTYIAGARFYFDAEKIASDGMLTRDGAHLKVKECLPLEKYLIWTATPDILNVSENTTPRIFAEKSDAVFSEKFSISLPHDTRN